MKKRFFLISIFFSFLYLALISNIYNLQIAKGSYYSARAATQNQLSGLLSALRGNIYFTDKNGNLFPAAINKKYYVIYAVPKEISAGGETAINQAAEKISAILNLDKTKLAESFSNQTSLYYAILKKADQNQANVVKEQRITGIYIGSEDLRYYPFNNVASQLLGFVSQNSESNIISGKYGAESYFNNILAGKDGELKGDKIIDSQDGADISLTIDPIVQERAESILDGLISQFKAEGGSIIVQDPKTGRIIAMGSYPNFDPNNFSASPIQNFINPVVQSIYEPGSVFKVLTMAAGLDAGKFTPDTTYVDKGFIILDGHKISNWDSDKKGAHGLTTMTGVIENSLNTGAAFAEQLIGKDLFYNYLIKFGFNDLTGIKLPGEVPSNISKLKTSSKAIDFATASFGQGIAVTPIAMINAFSAIANGGQLMRPIILASDKPQVIRQVISKDAAEKVVKMMVSAVDVNVLARVPGYYVAGKTGTAQIPTKGGYLYNQFIDTYIGFAPAYNPKFVILIKLDKAAGGLLAGATVVPAFKDLADFLLNYYDVPPDYINK
jgi:cell division protein FtsI (penicillin-binding protein 3)/stage V sporulation protein D (sporulation-specific penicillin-binding protein)